MTITATCDRCGESVEGNHYRVKLSLHGLDFATAGESVVIKDCCKICAQQLVGLMKPERFKK